MRRTPLAVTSRRVVGVRVVLDPPRPPEVVAGRKHLLLAHEMAGVVEGLRIGDAGQEELGPVIVDHRRGPGPVAGGDLGEVVPDGHQLDAVTGGGGSQSVEIGQWRDIGRLVEDDEKRRVERTTGGRHPLVGVLDGGPGHGGKERHQPALIVSRRAEIKRAGAVDEPSRVEGGRSPSRWSARGARTVSTVV